MNDHKPATRPATATPEAAADSGPLGRGGLSRRGFFGLTAAAVTLGAASGCTAGGAAQEAGPPRPGGRLRAVFPGGGAEEVLDPHTTDLYAEVARAKALFDKLAEYGSDMSPQPRLAERWESSPGLTTWRVPLRQAVFHDGRPVRAADVLYSYARILRPDSTRRAKASLSVIDLPNSRALDDRTVEFRLKRPYAEFPNAMATLGAYIVPEGAEDFAAPIGSGPFRFTSFEPGRSFRAAQEIGEDDIVQGGNNDADEVRPRRSERSGDAVGNVAQLLDSLHDAVAGCLRKGAVVAKNPRYGAHPKPRGAAHIA